MVSSTDMLASLNITNGTVSQHQWQTRSNESRQQPLFATLCRIVEATPTALANSLDNLPEQPAIEAHALETFSEDHKGSTCD